LPFIEEKTRGKNYNCFDLTSNPNIVMHNSTPQTNEATKSFTPLVASNLAIIDQNSHRFDELDT
jgi:hypothetical protein